MRDQRGFTLIETLAGILILGLVIVTSLLIFFERQKRLRSANERIVVWQALANEAEVERRVSYGWFQASAQPAPFQSDLTILKPLDGLVTQVTWKQINTGVIHVLLDVGWNDAKVRRHAQLTLIRVDTGGGSLW